MHRAIFLSDFHLGWRLAKAEHLLDFIESHDAETWYLVGDIYDIKRLRKGHSWPASHGRVIRALRRKARAGQQLVYLPGNHDPELRTRPGVRRFLPGIEVRPHAIHTTAAGRRLLVVHGDEYEPQMDTRGVSFIGGCACYLAGVGMSELIARGRARLGLGYWSLSTALKDRVLPNVQLIGQYRANLRAAARRAGCDGVVCGHIHHAAAEVEDGILYANCGDWVDSCTALAEHDDGRLELLHWAGAAERAPAPRRKVRPEPVPAW